MRTIFHAPAITLILALLASGPVRSQDVAIGQTVDSLLDYARGNDPEYASMRHEADAAGERVTPAGALPDPKFRMELQDITRMGDQNASLSPSRVGSTKYTVMQDLPWYGKRDLMREIAKLDDDGASQPASANQLRISSEKVQKLGVRSEAAQLRSLDKTVRAAGRIEPDERKIYAISPKFEGYVERLHVNVTGQAVSKGQPLFEVYSPERVSAQREYAIAAHGVDSLKDAGGQALYQITDLSTVWVVADVFEQDIGLARLGALATVRINAYPDKIFTGQELGRRNAGADPRHRSR